MAYQDTNASTMEVRPSSCWDCNIHKWYLGVVPALCENFWASVITPNPPFQRDSILGLRGGDYVVENNRERGTHQISISCSRAYHIGHGAYSFVNKARPQRKIHILRNPRNRVSIVGGPRHWPVVKAHDDNLLYLMSAQKNDITRGACGQ